jgi:hypothetical protein
VSRVAAPPARRCLRVALGVIDFVMSLPLR